MTIAPSSGSLDYNRGVNVTFEQWERLAQNLHNHADKVAAAFRARAKELCQESGLDPSLLGIHPHNAMVSFEQGKPWPNVDYTKVKLCLWFLDNQWMVYNETEKLISEAWANHVASQNKTGGKL